MSGGFHGRGSSGQSHLHIVMGKFALVDPFFLLLRFLLVLAPLGSTMAARVHTKQEYCEAETFRAFCSSGEVVVMENAKYGRMELGRCVIRDYGYVGCSANVLAHMDSRCSGRRSCEIRIPDSTLDRANPCPRDFKTYLEASYGCIKIHTPLCRTCRNATYIQAEMPGGYIASVSTEETGCGRSGCPWVLEAQPGQRLNITLLDFALSTRHRNNQQDVAGGGGGGAGGGASYLGLPEVCYTYATLREKGKEKPTLICGSRERVSSAYISDTNRVQIEVAEGKRGGNFGYFLLMYETIGCLEYQPPVNTWMKREGQTLTIGCVATGETWQLTCEDNSWAGYVGTCPIGPKPDAFPSSSDETSSLPVGILVTIILAIAMVIGVLILTVGLVMIKRDKRTSGPEMYIRMFHEETVTCSCHDDEYAEIDFQRRHQTPRDRPLNQSTPSSDVYFKEGHSTMRSQGFSTIDQKKYNQYKDKHPPHPRQTENEYAYNLNMELRPLPSIPDINEMDENAQLQGHPPSGGVPMFGPHGEGAYHRGLSENNHQIPSYDHTYFTAPSDLPMGPHYFELDPDGLPLPPQPEELGPMSSPLLRNNYPRPIPPGPPMPRPINSSGRLLNSTGPGHKSPEQENAENFGKETVNNSCQDVSSSIPSNTQLSFQETGNCSWP